MRIPQPHVTKPIHTSRVMSGSGTQPSQPRSAGGTTGPQGTLGGRRRAGRGGGAIFGPHIYLWILVLVEAALIGVLRKVFRRFHGG